MTKEKEQLAMQVSERLREMFGEGVNITYKNYFKTNAVLTGISIRLPGCPAVPTVYLEDFPDDMPVEEIANTIAGMSQKAFKDFNEKPIRAAPRLDRESILESVVLQALGQKRNRQLLNNAPHLRCLDLAGVFRIPVKAQKNDFHSVLITNQLMQTQGLTAEELTEAALRNTVPKLGVKLYNTWEYSTAMLLHKPFRPTSLERAKIGVGLYMMTNQIETNGAALMLIPAILETLGEKAGMDYYILPASIHELEIIRVDCAQSEQEMKNIIWDANRNPQIIRQEDILSDHLYRYRIKTNELEIVP